MPKKAKKKEESSVVEEATTSAKNNAIELALKSLKKKHGEDVLSWMSEKEEDNAEVISTGSLKIDYALGIGGIQRGRVYEIFGPNMSGKTTVCISIIKQAIAKGHKIIYVDAEHAMDVKENGLLAKMGIDTSQVLLLRGYTAEQNLDMAEALIDTGEFAICVIDSVSSLLPKVEDEQDSYENQTMGVHPKLMSRMCRGFTPKCSRTGTALLLINQIRSSMGGYGNPETTTGGNSIPHYASVRMRVSGGGAKSRLIKDSKGNAVGQTITVEVVKNKMAPPFTKIDTDLTYGKGFSMESEVLDLAVDMGFVDKAGSWFSYEGDKIGQGKDNSVAFLRENPEIYSKIETQVRALLSDE